MNLQSAFDLEEAERRHDYRRISVMRQSGVHANL
jgi:plasmid maintenance system antidote protein VapI